MPYKSTEAQRAYQREWARQRRKRARAAKDALKAGGCEECGEQELCCLAFHHRKGEIKLFNLGNGAGPGPPQSRNRTEAAIRAEAAKCVVLCHNCHAKVHAGLLDY